MASVKVRLIIFSVVLLTLVLISLHLPYTDQLEEISRVLCNVLEWAVQLESMPVVKLMVFGLRRFMKADKRKKYRDQMLDRYKIALRTFEQGGGTLHTRLERSKSRGAPPRRRRASSITECFYNGDTPGAMNCLLQNPGKVGPLVEICVHKVNPQQQLLLHFSKSNSVNELGVN